MARVGDDDWGFDEASAFAEARADGAPDPEPPRAEPASKRAPVHRGLGALTVLMILALELIWVAALALLVWWFVVRGG
jgi:hypothetical protein